MSPIPPGKLPHDLLRKQLSKITIDDPRVIVGPRIGEDCTVIRSNGRCLVATSDPVTFTAERIGWYGVHVNANDVAVMGARPLHFFATVLLPEGADEAQIGEIFDDILDACKEVGAALCGGHIEITAGLPRTILAGTMLGEVESDRLITKEGLLGGEDIILTKWAGLEGTAILATEKRKELSAEIPRETIGRAAKLIYDPGISVVKDALAACDAAGKGGIHAMHDPTEGGVATALHELADAAGCGMLVEYAKIPIRDDTRRFCEILGLDPLGIISSGALLIASDPQVADAVISALRAASIDAVKIGKITTERGVKLLRNGKELPMPRYDSDELSRVL